jgi:hypothetical protein
LILNSFGLFGLVKSDFFNLMTEKTTSEN